MEEDLMMRSILHANSNRFIKCDETPDELLTHGNRGIMEITGQDTMFEKRGTKSDQKNTEQYQRNLELENRKRRIAQYQAQHPFNQPKYQNHHHRNHPNKQHHQNNQNQQDTQKQDVYQMMIDRQTRQFENEKHIRPVSVSPPYVSRYNIPDNMYVNKFSDSELNQKIITCMQKYYTDGFPYIRIITNMTTKIKERASIIGAQAEKMSQFNNTVASANEKLIKVLTHTFINLCGDAEKTDNEFVAIMFFVIYESYIDLKFNNYAAFRNACNKGMVYLAYLLGNVHKHSLDIPEPNDINDIANIAIQNDHTEIVNILMRLNISDVYSNNHPTNSSNNDHVFEEINFDDTTPTIPVIPIHETLQKYNETYDTHNTTQWPMEDHKTFQCNMTEFNRYDNKKLSKIRQRRKNRRERMNRHNLKNYNDQ